MEETKVLHKKISTDASRSKVLAPKLRFKNYNDSWKKTNIGSFLTIGSGKDYKHLNPGNIPVYGTGGIMTWVDDYLYNGQTVCIGRKGTIDKPMYFEGKIWTVDTLFYTHSFIESYPKFIFNLFQKINWKEYNEASGVPSLSKATIEKINVFIPSLPEQQKIAAFLGAVDEKIQLLNRKKELLEHYKKGVMQQLFSGKLRFKDEKGKDYPKWEEKKLGNIGTILGGLTYSPDDVVLNGTLVLRSSNIQDRVLTFDDNVYVNVHKEDFNPVKENDILICVRNGSKNLIGKNALITKAEEGFAFGAFMTVFRSEYNNYLIHYFDSYRYKKQVQKNLGATINSINGSDLKKFKVPFPSKQEQNKIADYLSALDKKLEHLNQQITQTQNFKKGLLQQMFV